MNVRTLAGLLVLSTTLAGTVACGKRHEKLGKGSPATPVAAPKAEDQCPAGIVGNWAILDDNDKMVSQFSVSRDDQGKVSIQENGVTVSTVGTVKFSANQDSEMTACQDKKLIMISTASATKQEIRRSITTEADGPSFSGLLTEEKLDEGKAAGVVKSKLIKLK